MSTVSFVNGLNPAQTTAVHHASGSLAVIAGAGSGKTKVLTQRIGWLLHTNAWSSHRILAVTFTNKAAQEMKKRLESLGVPEIDRMWVGTFHGLCHRFLRRHCEAAKLSPHFQILDAQEQDKIVKKLYKANDWSVEVYDPKDAVRFINAQKDAGRRPPNSLLLDSNDKFYRSVYAAYQEQCDQNSWVDFGELLLRCAELIDLNEDIRLKYQTQFGHILVDEFQDTNDVQYAWVKRLSDSGQAIPVTVVGDMDQSIYSWRGAQMTNVQRFIDEFTSVGLVKLEQNYRSTPAILNAANTLIQKNGRRIPKNLWTSAAAGEPVVLFEARDEKEEAEWAVSQAIRQHRLTQVWSHTAVIYRSNAQSRILEESCIKRNLPYKIYGGIRFFERAEIKDALAHLAVIVNPKNDLALERALTSPNKGFGAKTLDNIRTETMANRISWFEAFETAKLTPKIATAWALHRDMWAAQSARPNVSLDEVVRWCVEGTGLLSHYQEIDRKDASDRADNLRELISVARRYTQGRSSVGLDVAQDFLASAALEADQDGRSDSDAIQLMTIHAAKGLEFPTVCAIGWDDGLFPSSQSLGDVDRLEEERRLAYVAITRAEQRLFISGAVERRQYGQYLTPAPSRFLNDLPAESVVWQRPPVRPMSGAVSQSGLRPSAPPPRPTSGKASYWSIGDKVVHPQWGTGSVLRVDGLGQNDRILVQFSTGDKKLLLPQLAKMRKE